MIYALISLGFTSFLASTLVPLPSEGALILFIKQYNNISLALFVATLCNAFGSLTTYFLGALGKSAILEKYFRINMDKVESFSHKYKGLEDLMAFLCFLPFVGDIFAGVLGLVNYSVYRAIFFITVGKFIRYIGAIYLSGFLG